MSTTRPRKDSTILAPIDIGDQPVGQYIFLTEGAAGTQAFSIDRMRVENEIVYGERCEPYELLPTDGRPGRHYAPYKLIIAVPVRSPWTVLAWSAVTFRTLEESMYKQKSDRAQEADLMKTVFGAVPEPTQTLPSAMEVLGPPRNAPYL